MAPTTTCEYFLTSLKWKPPSENTIDFKLVTRFPPDLKKDPNGNIPDIMAKPAFLLYQHVKGEEHEFYDFLYMTDERWESWKETGHQLDDRIVECAWEKNATGSMEWTIKRIRDDKTAANHKSTVERISRSIRDGVNADELVAAVADIQKNWQRNSTRHSASPPKLNIDPVRYGPNGPPPPMRSGGMPRLRRH